MADKNQAIYDWNLPKQDVAAADVAVKRGYQPSQEFDVESGAGGRFIEAQKKAIEDSKIQSQIQAKRISDYEADKKAKIDAVTHQFAQPLVKGIPIVSKQYSDIVNNVRKEAEHNYNLYEKSQQEQQDKQIESLPNHFFGFGKDKELYDKVHSFRADVAKGAEESLGTMPDWMKTNAVLKMFAPESAGVLEGAKQVAYNVFNTAEELLDKPTMKYKQHFQEEAKKMYPQASPETINNEAKKFYENWIIDKAKKERPGDFKEEGLTHYIDNTGNPTTELKKDAYRVANGDTKRLADATKQLIDYERGNFNAAKSRNQENWEQLEQMLVEKGSGIPYILQKTVGGALGAVNAEIETAKGLSSVLEGGSYSEGVANQKKNNASSIPTEMAVDLKGHPYVEAASSLGYGITNLLTRAYLAKSTFGEGETKPMQNFVNSIAKDAPSYGKAAPYIFNALKNTPVSKFANITDKALDMSKIFFVPTLNDNIAKNRELGYSDKENYIKSTKDAIASMYIFSLIAHEPEGAQKQFERLLNPEQRALFTNIKNTGKSMAISGSAMAANKVYQDYADSKGDFDLGKSISGAGKEFVQGAMFDLGMKALNPQQLLSKSPQSDAIAYFLRDKDALRQQLDSKLASGQITPQQYIDIPKAFNNLKSHFQEGKGFELDDRAAAQYATEKAKYGLLNNIVSQLKATPNSDPKKIAEAERRMNESARDIAQIRNGTYLKGRVISSKEMLDVAAKTKPENEKKAYTKDKKKLVIVSAPYVQEKMALEPLKTDDNVRKNLAILTHKEALQHNIDLHNKTQEEIDLIENGHKEIKGVRKALPMSEKDVKRLDALKEVRSNINKSLEPLGGTDAVKDMLEYDDKANNGHIVIDKNGKVIDGKKQAATKLFNGVKEGNIVRSLTDAEKANLAQKSPSPEIKKDLGIVDEVDADEPTKQSVVDRTGINHPFAKKVVDALKKLGVVKDDFILGGQVQSDGEGGFATGDMYFKKDGSISFVNSEGIIQFDKNGNVKLTELERDKVRTKTDVQSDIDSKTKSKQDFEKIRDSEDFKYKDVTTIDPLGRKVKSKRLKTADELKETTDKINKVIDKLDSEISDYKKELETAPEPSIKETAPPESQPAPLQSEGDSQGIGLPKPYEQRTDEEHAQYIKDKFLSEFTKKGVSKEGVDAAIALMEARAKASGQGDKWYRQIEDVGNGEFQSPDIKQQIIGEKGAINMSNAKDVLDNLNAAREMETQGKTPKEIHLATGWERGKDGRWRYEVADNINIDATKLENLIKSNATNIKISTFADISDLAKIYPEINNIKVHFLSLGRDSFAMSYLEHNGEKYIGINTDEYDTRNKQSIQQFRNELLHELQHFIQSNEGFSKGANRDAIFENSVKMLEKEKGRHLANKERESIQNSAHEIYHKVSGEVEARNVQNREKLSQKERKEQSLSETEDVARDQQILIDNLLFQNQGGEAKGALETLANGRKVIHALENPDFSTTVHELAHIFEDEISANEREAIQKWAKTKGWTTETSEAFARGFERYLREGKAPTEELKTIFQKAKEWLNTIYKTLKGSPIEKKLSPEVREVFDNLFKQKEESNKISKQSLKETPKEDSGGVGGDVGIDKKHDNSDLSSKSSIKSILNGDVDLKGNRKEKWMEELPKPKTKEDHFNEQATNIKKTKEELYQKIQDGIKSGDIEDKGNEYYVSKTPKGKDILRDVEEKIKLIVPAAKRRIETARQWDLSKIAEHRHKISEATEGKFQKAIEEGKMSATDAKKIIESAGLEVPEDIAEQPLKETPQEGSDGVGGVVDNKTKQQLLDERLKKIKEINDKAEGTREDRTKRYKELVNELGDETAALKKLQEEINAKAKKEIDKLPELPKTENEIINEKGENDFEKIKKDLGFKPNDYSWGNSPMDEDMGDMLLSKDKESVIFIKPNEVEVYDEKNDQTDTITNGVKIELVSTKENSRGKGKAKEMVQKVTDWADKNNTDLHLDIAPQDKSTTESGLKKLYESFGFEFDGIHGIRKPKAELEQSLKETAQEGGKHQGVGTSIKGGEVPTTDENRPEVEIPKSGQPIQEAEVEIPKNSTEIPQKNAKITKAELTIDNAANWLKDKLKIDGLEGVHKAGFGSDELIDLAAKAAKALAKGAIVTGEHIKAVVDSLKEGGFLEGFDENKILKAVADSVTPQEGLEPNGNTRINKDAIKEKYDQIFEHEQVSAQQEANDARESLVNSAEAKGISAEQEAENHVRNLASQEYGTHYAVSSYDIITTAFHKANLERDLARAKQAGEEHAAILIERQIEAVNDLILQKLGRASGKHLNLFSSVFNLAKDGTLKATQELLSKALGVDVPMTMEDLLKKHPKGDRDTEYKRLKPYVETIEAQKKAIEDKLKGDAEINEKYDKKDIEDYIKREVEKRIAEAKGKKTTKASKSLRSLAERIRKSDTLEKLGLGEPVLTDMHKAGTSFNVKEALAKVIDLIADGIDKAKAISDVLKEHGITSSKQFSTLVEQVIAKASSVNRDEVLDKIKEVSQAGALQNSISKPMVESGLVKDLVDYHIQEGLKADEVIKNTLADIKEVLTNVTEAQLVDAILQRGDFKIESRRAAISNEGTRRREVKTIATKMAKLKAFEAADEIHAIELDETLTKEQKKAAIEAKKSEFEKELDKQIAEHEAAIKAAKEKNTNDAKIEANVNKLQSELDRLKERRGKEEVAKGAPIEKSQREKDLIDEIVKEKAKWSSEKREQKRYEANVAELERLTNRAKKEKAQSKDKTPIEKSEREKELDAKIKEQEDKWDAEITAAQEARKANNKLWAETQRQLKQVNDLKEKIAKAEELFKKANPKSNATPDTPEIEGYKKQLRDTRKQTLEKEREIRKIASEMTQEAKIREKIEHIKKTKTLFEEAIKDRKKTRPELQKLREELNNAMTDAGIRAQVSDKTDIKIAKEYEAKIEDVRNSDLSDDEKVAKIQDLEKQRDAEIGKTKQGVLANLKSNLDGSIDDLTSKLASEKDPVKAEEIKKVLEKIKELSKFTKATTQNAQDKINKAYAELDKLIKDNKGNEYEQMFKDLQDEFRGDFGKALNEIQQKRLYDTSVRRLREAQRILNSGLVTEIPSSKYDKERDNALLMHKAKYKPVWQKVQRMKQRAIEQNKGFMDKALDLRTRYLIMGLHPIETVLTAGVTKPFFDTLMKQTAGRLAGMITGIGHVSHKDIGKTFGAITKGILDKKGTPLEQKAINKYISKMNQQYVDALKAYDAIPDKTSKEALAAEKKLLRAEIAKEATLPYFFINANSAVDIKQIMVHAATDFDERMGEYNQSYKKDRTKLENLGYWIDAVNRTHGAIKSVSARQAMFYDYIESLQHLQKVKGEITPADAQLAWFLAADKGYKQGKFSERTMLSDLITRGKTHDNAWVRGVSKFIFPVAKIAINIAKLHVDIGLPAEAIYKLAEATKAGKKLNVEAGDAARLQDNFRKGIDSLNLEQKKYLNTLLTRGLYGVAMWIIGVWLNHEDKLKYGGAFSPTDPFHKRLGQVLGSDGKPLKAGEWEINGWRLPEPLNIVMNHSGYFLPISLSTVWSQQVNREGATDAKTEAIHKNDVKNLMLATTNELTGKLPLQGAIQTIGMLYGEGLEYGLASMLPNTRGINKFVDKDENGEPVKRDTDSPTFLGKIYNIWKANNVGLSKTLPTKAEAALDKQANKVKEDIAFDNAPESVQDLKTVKQTEDAIKDAKFEIEKIKAALENPEHPYVDDNGVPYTKEELESMKLDAEDDIKAYEDDIITISKQK